MDTIFTMVI